MIKTFYYSDKELSLSSRCKQAGNVLFNTLAGVLDEAKKELIGNDLEKSVNIVLVPGCIFQKSSSFICRNIFDNGHDFEIRQDADGGACEFSSKKYFGFNEKIKNKLLIIDFDKFSNKYMSIDDLSKTYGEFTLIEIKKK